MGQNARVAMVPYKGFSMDDAIVVSESFAKRMSSQHNYEHDI
jgi:DNA-directed RNA polymerase beta subunit